MRRLARVVRPDVGMLGTRGKNDGAALAEADAGVAGCFAGAAEDDLVAVREEGAAFAGWEQDRLGAVASEFEKASGGGFGGAGDRSCGEDVADLQVAAVAGVVGDELRGRPVEVACVGFA